MSGFNKAGLKRMAGYTLDQTILIVAIIAILITLIVASVGWDLLSRAGGTKLASYLKQIENANGLFFSTHGMWPDDALATTGATGFTAGNEVTAEAQMQVLAAVLATDAVYGTNTDANSTRLKNNHSNLLSGIEIGGGNVLQHPFGGGGDIMQALVDTGSTALGDVNNGFYYVVQFNDVPIAEAEEADESIDGTLGADDGRVRYGTNNCSTAAATGTGSNVNVCYTANLKN